MSGTRGMLDNKLREAFPAAHIRLQDVEGFALALHEGKPCTGLASAGELASSAAFPTVARRRTCPHDQAHRTASWLVARTAPRTAKSSIPSPCETPKSGAPNCRPAITGVTVIARRASLLHSVV
jgi:hypothetical protein